MTQIRPKAFTVPSGRVVDLHDQSKDATGRFDVLIARTLRLAVEASNDPIAKVWYAQFQPVIDMEIHSLTKKLNIGRTLRKIGIAPPPNKKARMDAVAKRQARRRRDA